MVRLTPALRASVVYGLLTACAGDPVPLHLRAPDVNPTVSDPSPATITAVSECHFHGATQYCQAGTTEFRISGTATASSYTDCHQHDADMYCMAPTGEVQVIAAQAAQTVTPSPTQTAAAASLTAVSDCHLHDSTILCMAGTTEYRVEATATATQDVPPAYTGCHTHGTESLCIGPNGEEVEIHPAAEEDHEEDHSETSSAGQNCHFHAGVEHCTGGSSSATQSCARVDRDYNIRLRVGLLFVMLATSSIGVFTPILVASYISPKHAVFTILRQFGTGVIISTAFIHLYTHASLMFGNECLGELAYESTASAILMAGLFLSFLVEYIGNRVIQWHESKAQSHSAESGDHAHSSSAARTDMVNIAVLEAGVIFHSLLIGVTLVVAGDSSFLTLFAVIVFHQMFEGLALGTRIAALGKPCPTSAHDAHAHGADIIPGRNHAHGHEHYHDHSHDHAHSDSHPHPHSQGAILTPSTPEPITTEPKLPPTAESASTLSAAPGTAHEPGTVTLRRKLLLALAFALVTPLGMAIGIGTLHSFNGNDPSTLIAIGTLDALSAGILVWVGVVEMWAHDWMLGGEMTRASGVRTVLGLAALMAGMALMSLLGKWA